MSDRGFALTHTFGDVNTVSAEGYTKYSAFCPLDVLNNIPGLLRVGEHNLE
jgi:hypothetical protein